MVKAICAAGLLVASMLIGGCTAQPGKTTVMYERSSVKVPELKIVEEKGLYALFPGDGVQPLDSAYLNNGDKFGFESIDGAVVGVYIKGGVRKRVPLDEVLTSEYLWKYQGDKQP